MKTYSLHEVEGMFKVRHEKLKLLLSLLGIGKSFKDKLRLCADDIYKLHQTIKKV